MKALAAVLLLVLGLAASAAAGDYTLENRPEVVFKGGIVHQTPYPQGRRAASVWNSDACWRDCTVELRLEDGILRPLRTTPTPAGRISMPATGPASAPAATWRPARCSAFSTSSRRAVISGRPGAS